MKIGFIGAGNMGTAMIEALAGAKFEKDKICVYGREKGEKLCAKLGIKSAKNEAVLANFADIIILAIKPAVYESVLEKIKYNLENKILISLAPNFTISRIGELCGAQKIVRAMPNTPAKISLGNTALCFSGVSEEEKAKIREIFSAFGQTYEIDESKFAIFTAISGSLPAMIFNLIEAASDGAVRGGIAREMAHDIIANAVLGSASLCARTKAHPRALKDEVCSPGGTTIEMVATLEKMGFATAIIEAIKACEEKAKG
ncbi:pyrroline-5-carboxylate reductase [Campylobacter sp. JMF_01 NE2]|uniref:pyrroline-5-carboxylate reductase n=1 Tax=unclassified Campylobacter TaxID=2593542 RepID=UPI0022E9B51A|nr:MULTISPECIES: pyrroline-5-carboxylate reductase [unclassified Campylobacter]MDA3052831.1 pyrroline-5-carboxylate reductase [Campylobacter sp. JMF_03 NE3]MDA3067162.1 pyrroline-5-carboxylate reductase [Campylobacter sp. JMF_01 NE2]